MGQDISPVVVAKYVSAKRACGFVEDGMRLGLGTGSTAAWMVKYLAYRAKQEGLRLQCVPTSTRTAELATFLGLNVVNLEQAKWLDLTIDGADEFDNDLNLIKGGGGAHLQEKIVAQASDKMVVIADGDKKVATLGAFPLPIEVIKFGWQSSQTLIEKCISGQDVGARDITLRMAGDQPFETDEGNYILDLHLQRIGDAATLSNVLNQIPGVVENGLFLNICSQVVLGFGDGRVELHSAGQSAPAAEQIEFMNDSVLNA